MRTKISLFSAILLVCSFVVLPACAQGTQVPDLSSNGWQLENSRNNSELLADNVTKFNYTVGLYLNQNSRSYVDQAVLITYKGNEFLMKFGDRNDASGVLCALKVNGKWHVAKNKGLDTVKAEVISPDGKSFKIKFSLDSVDGPQEVVLDIN